MKHIIIFTIFISSLIVKAQNTIYTAYFSFNCNCTQDENYYNPKNQSHNYSYGELKGDSGYLLAVREMKYRDKQQQKSYLNSIKNSGTFNYIEGHFGGEYALIADIFQPNAFGKQIVLFHGNIAYTMMVVGASKATIEKLYKSFESSFQFKYK